MVKKLLTLTLGLMTAFGAAADNYPYPESNIQFWTGRGSNEAVVVISWDDEDASYAPQGFAWGVRFNGAISGHALLDSIAAYDSRFTFSFSGTLLSTISYNDNANNIHLTPSIQYNCFYQNGTFAPDVYDNIFFTDGDMMEVSESCMFDCSNITPATDPNGPTDPQPEESTIAAGDIVYWVGSGSHEAVLAVNWADTALAWGYRFAADSVSVQQMLEDIAAADPRFSIEPGAWGLGDIRFAVAAGDTLRGQAGSYWESKLNGVIDMGMSQMLHDGDFEKWAEPAAGVVSDSMEYGGVWYYMYTYTMTIHPVSVPGNEGIATAAAAQVSIYPNPATGSITISGAAAGSADLYDMSGRRVATATLAEGRATMNLDGVAAGIYMLRAGSATTKIVVR